MLLTYRATDLTDPLFSPLVCQVFLGGVPWDITESALAFAFRPFGPIRVEWPGKDSSGNPPKGYVYVLFESEKHVKAMLEACTYDLGNTGNCYFKISSRRMRSKEVGSLAMHVKTGRAWEITHLIIYIYIDCATCQNTSLQCAID